MCPQSLEEAVAGTELQRETPKAPGKNKQQIWLQYVLTKSAARTALLWSRSRWKTSKASYKEVVILHEWKHYILHQGKHRRWAPFFPRCACTHKCKQERCFVRITVLCQKEIAWTRHYYYFLKNDRMVGHHSGCPKPQDVQAGRNFWDDLVQILPLTKLENLKSRDVGILPEITQWPAGGLGSEAESGSDRQAAQSLLCHSRRHGGSAVHGQGPGMGAGGWSHGQVVTLASVSSPLPDLTASPPPA